MVALTAEGSFAQAYKDRFKADIISYRRLGEKKFLSKLRGSQSVIHNAATIEGEDLDLLISRNFDFTRYLVTQLQETNPDCHLIFLSSMSILDPANESLYRNVLDMTAYTYSKYLAETYCLKSRLRHVSCVRFSTLFFKDPRKDGLSKLIEEAVNNRKITIFDNGVAKRNFLPINVAVQYVNKLTSNSTSAKRVYNIAAPESTSFRQVADILKDMVVGLKINDEKTSLNAPVLSEFSDKDIKSMGIIQFSLENEIKSYAQSIKK